MTTKTNKYGLKPKQIKLAEKLADPSFTGTVTQLCSEVGVARTTFYAWMGQDVFRDYLTELINRYADSELASVWKALIRRCVAGDVQAIKLYFDVRSRSTADNVSHDMEDVSGIRNEVFGDE